MRSLQFGAYDDPTSWTLADVAPTSPGAGQVRVSVEAAAVNPSDFMLLAGRYPFRPALPSPAGSEGVGRVVETGPGVSRAGVGDRVLILPHEQPGTWQDETTLDERFVVRVQREVDPRQLATAGINGATARLLLAHAAGAPAGAWIAQTAANSDLGQYVVALAKRAGWRTVNVVRRASAAAVVTQAGGDAALVDDDTLPGRLAEVLGDDDLALVLDGVGGPVADVLAARLRHEGSLVSYSAMSGRPVAVHPVHLNFKNLHVHGFWLNNWLSTAPAQEIDELYAGVVDLIADGVLRSRIEAVYELADWPVALDHARSGSRTGKVLLAPAGPAGNLRTDPPVTSSNVGT